MLKMVKWWCQHIPNDADGSNHMGRLGQGKWASEMCCQPLVLAAGWGQCQWGNGEQQMLFCIPCLGKIVVGKKTHEKMEVYLRTAEPT